MNITKLAEQYVENHPSVKDCVRNRLINYSKLSRRIIRAVNLKDVDFDAVLIACRRYFRKISEQDVLEEKIVGILSRSRLEVKNKTAVVVIDKDVFTEDLLDLEKKAKKSKATFYAVEGSNTITLVVSSELIGDIKGAFRGSVRKCWENLALVKVRSPEGEQDATPGFIAFLTGRISQRGINIPEFISCWSETLLVINESDIAAVMEALKI